jgi:hypothetical protein
MMRTTVKSNNSGGSNKSWINYAKQQQLMMMEMNGQLNNDYKNSDQFINQQQPNRSSMISNSGVAADFQAGGNKRRVIAQAAGKKRR